MFSIAMKNSNTRVSKKELCAASGTKLNETALKALREAALRRREKDVAVISAEDCSKGRPEPTRFGDWEAAGRCSDF